MRNALLAIIFGLSLLASPVYGKNHKARKPAPGYEQAALYFKYPTKLPEKKQFKKEKRSVASVKASAKSTKLKKSVKSKSHKKNKKSKSKRVSKKS